MKTVLFVDDELPILNAIERIYHERDDVRILFAESGSAALKTMQTEDVWVVVSDYLMPGMRGIDFLAKVKMQYPQTVRIMMTAHADFSIAVDAINKIEAFRFVTKPWDNKELMDTVDDGLTHYELVKSLSTNNENVYLSLAQTIELKDPYTKGHCDRVARYALSLAQKAGISDNVMIDIKHGSWLHDCGKIGVPEIVLNRPYRLSDEAMNLVKMHPQWGAEVARQARMPDTVINIILYHHERFYGGGYPTGLSGELIPIEARIVGIADVFDALFTARPYRKAYSLQEAIKIMCDEMVSHFDPYLMELFRSITDKECFDD